MPATVLLNYSQSVEPERWPAGSDGAAVSPAPSSLDQSHHGSARVNRPHKRSVRRPAVHVGGTGGPQVSRPESHRQSKRYYSAHPALEWVRCAQLKSLTLTVCTLFNISTNSVRTAEHFPSRTILQHTLTVPDVRHPEMTSLVSSYQISMTERIMS